MDALNRKVMGIATGAGCGLGGLLTALPCAGAGCASCFGCAGLGVGLVLLLAARKACKPRTILANLRELPSGRTSLFERRWKLIASHAACGGSLSASNRFGQGETFSSFSADILSASEASAVRSVHGPDDAADTGESIPLTETHFSGFDVT